LTDCARAERSIPCGCRAAKFLTRPTRRARLPEGFARDGQIRPAGFLPALRTCVSRSGGARCLHSSSAPRSPLISGDSRDRTSAILHAFPQFRRTLARDAASHVDGPATPPQDISPAAKQKLTDFSFEFMPAEPDDSSNVIRAMNQAEPFMIRDTSRPSPSGRPATDPSECRTGCGSSATARPWDGEDDLARRVKSFLAGRNVPGLRRLLVEVEGNSVILHGRVRTYYEKQLAITCCQRVAGVLNVIDEIEVQHPGACASR
jgi:BON domain-containing protein